MKHAVSISLGSSKRDKSVKVNLNGREILVEHIGRWGYYKGASDVFGLHPTVLQLCENGLNQKAG